MEKWIFENYLSAGDVVMLTAAIRDLHRAYPGRFVTDVRTSCPGLWEHNPYLTVLNKEEPDVKSMMCHYPLIHRCNDRPYHFLHGFIEFLNEQLDLRIQPTAFGGDIHLSREETAMPALVEELLERPTPYWIIAAGGKFDYTIKWWHRRRWQEVVDHFRGQIQFVQVGQQGHYHPPLQGVLDLRGKTTLRDLIRLMYHADGVLCPVTLYMHLAAAVPLPPRRKRLRHCVVVAGGREPAHWEEYPGHHYLHTIGALECCAAGGCWKSRAVPLGDGSTLDRAEALCVDVSAHGLPKCMDMIRPTHVIESIHLCQQTDVPRHLTQTPQAHVQTSQHPQTL